MHFTEGFAELTLPDFRNIGVFHPKEVLAYTATIDGWCSPRMSRRGLLSPEVFSLSSDDSAANERVDDFRRFDRDSIAGYSVVSRLVQDDANPFARVSPGDLEPLQLKTADTGTVLAEMLADAGYRSVVSDKGQKALALLNLIGQPQYLDLIASSCVYRVFREMSEIIPRQAVQQGLRRVLGHSPTPTDVDSIVQALQRDAAKGNAQFERHHRSFGSIQKLLGIPRPEAAWLVEWLVERQLVFRGYEVRCSSCGGRRWYSAERLGPTHHCDSCRAITSSSIPVDRPLEWRFRLNELAADAVDQGVLPHLLAVRRMMEWANHGSLLGVVPGLTLMPLDPNGLPEIEIDALGIASGRIVIAECKQHGGELTMLEVNRISELGRRLNCAGIIYATSTDFRSVRDIVEHAISEAAPITVECWDSSDLFDRDAWQLTQADDHMRAPDDAEATAINYLIEMVEGFRLSSP